MYYHFSGLYAGALIVWRINILVRIHVVWWPGWLGSRVGGTWICTRWQPHKPHATVAPPSNTNTNTNKNTNTNTSTNIGAQKRAVALSPPTTAEEAGDPGWYVLTQQRLRHLGWKWVPSCDITRGPVTPWCHCWALYNPQPRPTLLFWQVSVADLLCPLVSVGVVAQYATDHHHRWVCIKRRSCFFSILPPTTFPLTVNCQLPACLCSTLAPLQLSPQTSFWHWLGILASSMRVRDVSMIMRINKVGISTEQNFNRSLFHCVLGLVSLRYSCVLLVGAINTNSCWNCPVCHNKVCGWWRGYGGERVRASQSVTVLVNLGPDLNCIIDHQLLMPFIKHHPPNKKMHGNMKRNTNGLLTLREFSVVFSWMTGVADQVW